MKKFILMLLLIVTALTISTSVASCGGDEPDTPDPVVPDDPNSSDDPDDNDRYQDLYGYWINSDKSGAMEIVEKNSSQCIVKYFVYTSKGVKDYVSDYFGGKSSFTALTSDGSQLSVKISSNTDNKILLKDAGNYSYGLSSYVFTRVDEDDFYSYIENGGDNGDQGDSEMVKKLLGTWVGIDYNDIITLTFYSSGKAKETWLFDDGTSETINGTYTCADGKITSWMPEEGSVLSNTIGECPWPVVFRSSTSIVVGEVWQITFTKK